MRPVSGAVIRVNSTLSSAERIAALAASTAAVATLQVGDALVVGAGRLEILFAQLGGALELPSCQIDLGLRLRQLRPRGRERRLVGPRVDDEQQIALFDELAVLEMDFGQIAADPRADLDIVLGGELPGDIRPTRRARAGSAG